MSTANTRCTEAGLTTAPGWAQEHEEREKLLADLARLLGCTLDISRHLPDGKKPDVMQLNLARRTLFLGDAKVTETPSNKNTQRRLGRYIAWAAAHASRAGSVSLLAICFKNQAHAQGWADTLYGLGLGAGITPIKGGFTEISAGSTLLWFVFKQPVHTLGIKEGTR